MIRRYVSDWVRLGNVALVRLMVREEMDDWYEKH